MSGQSSVPVRNGLVAIGLALWAPAAPACGQVLQAGALTATPVDVSGLSLLNRVSWGVNAADAAAMSSMGPGRWLEAQLHPPAQDRLPSAVQAAIDALPALHTPMIQLVNDAEKRAAAADAIKDREAQKAAYGANYKALIAPAQEAAVRSVLRDLYSPDQLKEQMTWFWFNHFNVLFSKPEIPLIIGDYEDTLRARAFGKFRDLLEATVRHPVMLRYLDNAANIKGRINENYAREVMELHTLGLGSGYTQADVLALAHILTGVGINTNPNPPAPPPQFRADMIRSGLFEFNPAKHDYSDQVLLGRKIRGRGFAEVEEALDILCRHPATAQHISRKLAIYFVSDDPPDALVQRMTQTFQTTDGDITAVLETMFNSHEFKASLGSRFKDPVHFVISAVRVTYNDRAVGNIDPVLVWINNLGQGIHRRETPDGYPMISTAWDGPGQLQARFGVARQIGYGGGNLFNAGAPGNVPPPDLKSQVQAAGIARAFSPATSAALAQAGAPAEWNTLFLASPEFMRR